MSHKGKVVGKRKTEKQHLHNFLVHLQAICIQREGQFMQAFSNLKDKRQAWQDFSGLRDI